MTARAHPDPVLPQLPRSLSVRPTRRRLSENHTMAYASGAPRDPTEVLGRRISAYVIDGLLVLISTVLVLSLVRHDSYRNAPVNACTILSARRAALAHASGSVMCLRLGSHAW